MNLHKRKLMTRAQRKALIVAANARMMEAMRNSFRPTVSRIINEAVKKGDVETIDYFATHFGMNLDWARSQAIKNTTLIP